MKTRDKDSSLHIPLAVHGESLRRPTPASNELDPCLGVPKHPPVIGMDIRPTWFSDQNHLIYKAEVPRYATLTDLAIRVFKGKERQRGRRGDAIHLGGWTELSRVLYWAHSQ